MAELLTAVSETVMGAPVIRAYAAQTVTRERTFGAIERHRVAQVRAARMSALLFPSGELFSVFTVSAVLVVGVLLGPARGLTAGEIVAFIFLVNLFLQPVAEFTDIVDQTQTAVAGWRRILDLLDTPIDLPDPDPGVVLPSEPPALTIEGVSFRYRETGAARPRRHQRLDPRGFHGGARGRDRFGEDDAGEAARAPRRPDVGSGPRGRRRPARRGAVVVTADARDGAAGGVPVRLDDR